MQLGSFVVTDIEDDSLDGSREHPLERVRQLVGCRRVRNAQKLTQSAFTELRHICPPTTIGFSSRIS
jgi:hypothetical protein